jgi:hypothetical protein
VDDALSGAPTRAHREQRKSEVRGRHDFGRRLRAVLTIWQFSRRSTGFLIPHRIREIDLSISILLLIR